MAVHPLHARFESVCVTGTNGKSTTTSIVDAIVRASGARSVRVTTLGGFLDDVRISEGTPIAAFDACLERALEAGARVLALETTSKALARGWARRWPPRVAVFTNLTRDHLDYHRSPEDYLAAKAQLFMALVPGGLAVLNARDPASALVDEVVPAHATRVAYRAGEAHPDCARLPLGLAAVGVAAGRDGTRVVLGPGALATRLGGELVLRVVGAVHADNALAAALAADAIGIDAGAIRAGLEAFQGVPGRFQIVARRPLVAVDYAHTPDALATTLALARSLARPEQGRVIVVFGCGGDRDRGKRPEMGAIASRVADQVVLTTDNARTEDPARIAEQVQAGADGPATWTRELDRARAIELAIGDAAERDVVVIAGKGHEATQTVGATTVAFSDLDVARDVCDRFRRS